jgi:lipopolysaccharide/colanic/teichoic acid biosynthesis glycosyltransferase
MRVLGTDRRVSGVGIVHVTGHVTDRGEVGVNGGSLGRPSGNNPLPRFLRRYSLDELPQLISVLKGEMPFVGPRPALEREVAQYGPDMHRRLPVTPGITGLWQVSGRSGLSWEEAVELDTRYVDNWSPGLDLAILLRIFRAILRSPGAY